MSKFSRPRAWVLPAVAASVLAVSLAGALPATAATPSSGRVDVHVSTPVVFGSSNSVKSIEVDNLNGTRRACEDFGSFTTRSGARGDGAVDLSVRGLNAHQQYRVYSYASKGCAPTSYLVGSGGVINTGQSLNWTVYTNRAPSL